MSIQSSINRIIGSVESGVSDIQTGIERGEKTEHLKKEVGLQKQQLQSQKQQLRSQQRKLWSQKGQLARMKKANERIRERQQVLKEQNKQLKLITKQKQPTEKITIGGSEISPNHPLYKTLMGGKDGTTK